MKKPTKTFNAWVRAGIQNSLACFWDGDRDRARYLAGSTQRVVARANAQGYDVRNLQCELDRLIYIL